MKTHTLTYFLFGSIAGFTSISCSYPFEIIKRRMQLSGELGNPLIKNTFSLFTSYVFTELYSRILCWINSPVYKIDSCQLYIFLYD